MRKKKEEEEEKEALVVIVKAPSPELREPVVRVRV